MDKENGAEEATTSNSGAGEQNQHNENQKNNARVPFYKIFSFVDSIDKALMIIGSIGAVANGVCMPLMAIIIGELVDSFGENQNTKKIIHVISKVSLKFVYLAIGVAIAAFLHKHSKSLIFCSNLIE
ncbi:ABC transporter B family member 11-like [Chenopodium quinoa]|uniref:ABC transporter B family member 11-like n=1 Tax=Chenopodium quinoa TaxID=63459 RepID=UPI000B78DAE8|nr:ABC transporter B family member 11-like [Chenopodium quinoa]